jgi:ribonuclease E
MKKKILVDASYAEETRVVVLDNNDNVEHFEYEVKGKAPIKGNVYLAKVVRVEPALQSAFIDYGGNKNGFLSFSEIHPNYYNASLQGKGKEDKVLLPFKLLPVSEINDVEILQYEDPEILTDSNVEIVDLTSSENEIEIDVKIVKDYKIQDVIKKGQVILVQAQKEERGNKGATFTSYISLAGKYSVAMPNRSSHNGVSRKIINSEERKRLKCMLDEITKDSQDVGLSIIMRTAGIGRKSHEIKQDYNYIVRLWNKILDTSKNFRAPYLLHVEEGIIEKTVRDFLDHRVKEMIVQGKDAYNQIIKLVDVIVPSDKEKIKQHMIDAPIFSHYNVEKMIITLYQPIVELSSGGYVVINPTEALTSIDVNSGKAIGEQDIEETAFKTNVEAARQISKQLRLRDISGLVVIDFIDMVSEANKKSLLNILSNSCSQDKAKIQLSSISNLGLVQLSRQRIKSSFLETHSVACNNCQGKGVIRSEQANSMLILRTVEDEIVTANSGNIISIVNIFTNAKVISYLLNYKRKLIDFIENKYQLKLNFHQEHLDRSDSFSIEKIMLPRKKQKNIIIDKIDASKPTEEIIENIREKPRTQELKNIHRKNIKPGFKSQRRNNTKPETPTKIANEVVAEKDSSFFKQMITKIMN